MDDHPISQSQPDPADFDAVLDEAAERLAEGLAHDIDRALADPIVRLLLAADRLDGNHVAAVLHRIAARLHRRPSREKAPRGRAAPYSF